ncbi:MAG: ATP synthase subunit C [Nitrososphaerales archaeon]|jgi:V/A-type H+/Na+-transporting ATPase subunit K
MKELPLLLLGVAVFVLFSLSAPVAVAQTAATDSSSKFFAASLTFGVAAIAAGYAIGQSGSAAIAAVAEKPEVRTSALVFVALAEAIAIYGFVMAIIILGQTG